MEPPQGKQPHLNTDSPGKSPDTPEMNSLFPLVACGLLLIVFAATFLRFFPNRTNHLGHDFSYFYPALLDGYFWFKNNGILEIPWFTPGACGGSLVYPNVVRGYYTVSQFLTFIGGPLAAVRITLVGFAGFGLWGSYLLLRRSFCLSRSVAIYGAGVFLFNGFFAHRMLIGHLGYCHFMLIPMVAYLILTPAAPNEARPRLSAFHTCILGGLLLAAAVQSEFVITMIPAVMALVVTGLIHSLIYGKVGRFLLRLGMTGLIGILLSLSRLSAILYLLGNFPRDAFKLPGADGWLEAAGLILRALMISPVYDPDRVEAFTNVQYFLDRHEWEYSVSPIPFIVIVCGFMAILVRSGKKGWPCVPAPSRIVSFSLIGLLLLLPVALNSYYPGWNAFLKQFPIIGSSSSLIRWTIAYIPVIMLVSSLVLEKMNLSGRFKKGVVFVCLAAIVLLNAFTDREYYHRQDYDPAPIAKAYKRVANGLQAPIIDRVVVCRNNDTGAVSMPIYRNDAIAYGGSQMLCYEAIFGYWLEFFTLKGLHPGSVLSLRAGRYNLKNPACYIWPAENKCQPGDHFKQTEKAAVTAFANYKPFPFKMPPFQKIANWINGIGLLSALLFVGLYYLAALLAHRRSPPRN